MLKSTSFQKLVMVTKFYMLQSTKSYKVLFVCTFHPQQDYNFAAASKLSTVLWNDHPCLLFEKQ